MVATQRQTWQCAAIDHGLAVFPDGRVGPCCQIAADYLKPAAVIPDPDRFGDLRTEHAPSACEKCVRNEHDGVASYRQFFNSRKTVGTRNIAFLDIRNTNQCNLKCRYCGPHFSNQWAIELNQTSPLRETSLEPWHDHLLTRDLQVLYFTGGEPMVSGHHWQVLQKLVDGNLSKNVSLMYNTNLTQLRYKQLDIFHIWNQFQSVNIMASIDAIGNVFDNIRSGARWANVDQNIQRVLAQSFKGRIKLSLSCVLSILNIWHLEELIKYCQDLGLEIDFILLDGPDYLALDVIPDQLQAPALAVLERCQRSYPHAVLEQARQRIENNQNQVLFKQCLTHVLLLDHMREEQLFRHLPFRDLAQALITSNHEYE